MLSNLRVPQARVLPGALLLALLLLVLPAAATAQSQPYTAGQPVLVSGPSPFAGGCAGAQPGVNYRNAEVEPYVAVNPTNGSNFVGGWQQDRWSNGGANSLRAGVTFDAGATWTSVTIPSITLCAGGPEYQRATDPWVTFSPNGTAYFFSYALNATSPANAMLVSRSTDGGLNWDPDTGYPLRTGDIIPQFAADPSSNAHYAVWQDARFGTAGDAIAFAQSTDGGLTWSTPMRISQNANVQAFTPAIAVAADGTIGVTYYDFRSNTPDPFSLPTDLWFVSSRDGGATWSETHVSGPFDHTVAPNARGYFLGDYSGLAAVGRDFVAFFAAANTGNTDNRTDIFSAGLTAP